MIKKADFNQKDIVAELKKHGISVFLTHEIGKGFPDIVVGYGGKNYLFEIKNLSNGRSNTKLTPAELKFHQSWQGKVNVVFNFQDVKRIIGYE